MTHNHAKISDIPDPSSSDMCVLLIEDHVVTAKLISSYLIDHLHCKVLQAYSLAQARQILSETRHTIYVIVCDLNLPDARHGEVIDGILRFSVPVIALTGEYSEELRETMLNKGVVDYILKNSPAALSYLLELVKRICKNAHTKVLVVDDSISSRKLLTANLIQQNLQVLTANNGLMALEVLAAHPEIKLVLVDYEMPLMDGVSFVVEARKTRKKDELAIVGISASSDGKLSGQFLKNGANDFIHKPYIYEEILCRVSQNLEMLDLLEQSRNAAICDFLTGLFNRRHFHAHGEKLLEAVTKKGGSVALAMIDIDHFKEVNDTFGHAWGDVALQKTARAIQKHFAFDLACRFGGEEFAVLFLDKATPDILAQLEDFRHFQEQNPLTHSDGTRIHVRVSIGLEAEKNAASVSGLTELFKKADARLYQAKQQGRNRVVA